MKHPLIIGMGKTGQSIFNWYQKQGIKPQTYDDRDPKSICWDHIDVVHPSPGISLDHALYQEAKNRRLTIMSDAHIAQKLYPQHRYIGITGSNGKSTTSALLAHLLDEPVLLGGNIGLPILDQIPANNDIHTFVWELSSFQLDIGDTLHFDAAAILNLTPNHLDRHGTMEAYRQAKVRIFYKSVCGFTGIDVPEATCQLLYLGNEFGVEKDCIRALGQAFDFPQHLIGYHNYINASFALSMALHMGVDPQKLKERLQTFYPLEHRLELVWEGKWEGINLRIINDSKSTTAEATRSALKALSDENIWLIAGGVPKSGGITSLASDLTHLKGVCLIGEAMNEFAITCQKEEVNHTLSQTMDRAIQQALYSIQTSNMTSAVLLLSPACASYDQFDHFEHRGNVFKEHIRSIPDFALNQI